MSSEESKKPIIIIAPSLSKAESTKAIAIWIGIGLLLNILSLYMLAVLFGVLPLWFVGLHSFIFEILGASRSMRYRAETLQGKVNKFIKEQKKQEDAISDETGTGGDQNNPQV